MAMESFSFLEKLFPFNIPGFCLLRHLLKSFLGKFLVTFFPFTKAFCLARAMEVKQFLDSFSFYLVLLFGQFKKCFLEYFSDCFWVSRNFGFYLFGRFFKPWPLLFGHLLVNIWIIFLGFWKA